MCEILKITEECDVGTMASRPPPKNAAFFHVSTILLTAILVLSLVLLRFSESEIDTESVFVSYAYSEGSRTSAPKNLLYFLKNGVFESSLANVEYGIVVNGRCSSRQCAAPTEFSHVRPGQLLIWHRENIGYDFGAHNHALTCLDRLARVYNYYIFLNSGVSGPFVPSYIPKSWHWSMAFTKRLGQNVGVMGSSVVCLSPMDEGGYGPSIEGFVFGMTRVAVASELLHGSSFLRHKNKRTAILRGEYALTDSALQAGLKLETILSSFDGINWENEHSWFCNNRTHPTRSHSYFDTSINPLDVLFHKVEWGLERPRPVKAVENLKISFAETNLHFDWKL